MAKNCIMCKEVAGSKEHVFPAAFGGRRMNKGIYCQQHNEDLGHHVNELMKVLGYFNASLGVRSDHHAEPKPFVFTLEDGQRFQKLEENIEFAPPLHLSQTPELIGKKVELSFASYEQRDQWIAKQKESGYQFHSSVTESRTTHFAESMRQRINLSDEAFHRGVAYLALTHLANYFPDLARQDCMAPIRRCVLGEEALEKRVWLVDPDLVWIPHDDSFPFTHATILSLSAATGRAVALVVFFKHLYLAVDLGPVSVESEKRVITLVDPLTQRAGKTDINVTREDLPLRIPTADQEHEYKLRIWRGETPNPAERIMAEHTQAQFSAFAQDLIPRLIATNALEHEERLLAVRVLVDECGQRVLNALTDIIRGIVASAEPPKIMLDELSRAIETDPSTQHGLTERSWEYLEITKNACADQLIRLLDDGSLDEQSLMKLFDQPTEMIIPALEVILRPAVESLR